MNKKQDTAVRIGMRLHEIRKSKGLTLLQLEAKSSIDRHYLSRIENGKNIISIFTLTTICETMDITLKEFFDEF